MIGVILCTHSTFAKGLSNAIEMIAGEQQDFEVFCFMNGDDPDELAMKMSNVADQFIAKGIPYIVAVDLYAATPFNTALRVALEKDAYVLTGVNLPMMLDLLLSREAFDGEDLQAFLENSMQNVKDSMQVIHPKTLFQE